MAHAYLLPLSAMQISSMPLTELNRIVHSLQLTSQQQNMIRKIRRRGKNKLAARVCRKRKNDRVKV
ncbi:unnamed protein product [Anisakis simplex]|uniref:Basic leucine zipper domain-containing protein n=1 Tax=Anisakis simplex TaxID=6269 RepID=A0A3P6QHH2_ANISI|nr:unnamed protein product [Anisakis simplex]